MQVSTNIVDTYVFYPSNVSLNGAFGKWVLFCFKRHIDVLWQKLHCVMDLLLQTKSVLCMRVSTGRPNPHATNVDISVIMVYTHIKSCDEQTMQQVQYVGNMLHAAFNDAIGFAAPDQFSPYERMYYKTQEQSRQGSRMTGKTKGNTLTSIRLPDHCVSSEQCSFSEWIEKNKRTTTKPEFCGMSPLQLHALGALWDPSTNHWFAPTEKVLRRMNAIVSADTGRASPPPPPPPPTELLTLLSINVWGNVDRIRHHTASTHIPQRMRSILTTIETIQPDVLCLQEVQDQEAAVLHPQLCAQGYLVADANRRSVVTYVHSVHIRLDWSEYSEQPVRIETLCLTHKATSLQLSIANVHLPCGKQSASLRLLALQQSVLGLQAMQKPWVLAGDTNLTFEQNVDVEQLLPHHVQDAWIAAGSPMNMRATYDYTKNTNLACVKVGERFDRAFFDCSKLKLVDFKLVCTDVVPETKVHPSDHFGLCVTFAI